VTSVVTLRPYAPADQPLLRRTDSEFDDVAVPGIDPTVQLPSSSFDQSGGLVVCENGVAVGTVSWHHTQWGPTAGSRHIMIGIGLTVPARGRGIGTRAQRLLAELLFAHTRVHRVEAATELGNVAEQRSLEKAGFTREGVVRESLWRRGAFHDSVLYSRLRTDPAPAG
jgi:RimJ/RimL family protein N-acetyltransferase